ncbi:MAG TPA: YhjD/YihY/BrkB family envelope integrity protein [Acidimicrobiales bacterium]|nr:YhjD/YihY/BrkB family envelope integrity protein [Acidimicrobiales bacterium]
MPTVSCAVEIDSPAEPVYEQWSRSERFPRFMGGAAERRRIDPISPDWVTLLEGKRRDFDAVVTDHVAGQRVAWEGSGERFHAGVVTFAPLAGDRTRVMVEVDWEPGSGADQIANRLVLRRQLQADLDAFRAEAGATVAAPVPAGGGGTGAPLNGNGATAWAPTEEAASTDGDERGRGADAPSEIPPAGWLDILKRTMGQLKSDNVPIVAAGVGFYVFLAMVPAIVAVVSVYGLVADPVDVQRQLGSLLGALPSDAADLVRTQVEAIAAQGPTSLGVGVVVSVLAALWAASKGMQALIVALNIAYDEEETRKFLRLRALALALTVALALAAVVGVGGMVLAGKLASALGTFGEIAIGVLRWPVLGAFAVLVLAVLYRYSPDRDAPAWRWVSPGAVVATVLWLVGSVAFAVYVNNFGKYNETYGSLGAVVVLLLWLFLTAYVIIFGAELDAESERQTRQDTTRGAPQAMGEREAYAADTVAPAPAGRR